MNFTFDQSRPIYQQLADQLEEMIFLGIFKPHDQVPSTTQLSQQLHVNPATILKGMNQLVDKGLLEKKRGLGMFVTAKAPAMIQAKRQEDFYSNYVKAIVAEACKLNINEDTLINLIKRGYDHD
ncbi:GntR family transcriptional regulator [Ligilactobacillus equi]|nr:GntR family transcriptional regulator [Ligilactobacillus equi]